MMPPDGIFRPATTCSQCNTKQFLERLPGMEFFATIPLRDEFIANPFMTNCKGCGQVNIIDRPHCGMVVSVFDCLSCGTTNTAVENKKGEIEVHLTFGIKKAKIEAPTFAEIGAQIGKLVEEKQKQYGSAVSSAGPILKELYPDGIKPEQYNDLALIVRMLDKISRITKGNGEGGEDAWGDIIGYGILGKANVQNR
jgi:hypothetical protein